MRKNILITGGLGFIGSNFINSYYKNNNLKDFSIVNLDKQTYAADPFNIEESVSNSNNYTLIKGDICNKELVDYIFNKHNIDSVISLAAESHVDNSIDGSDLFIKSNIVGTHCLLEVAKKYWKNDYNKHRFLQVSCYDEETRAVTKAGFKKYYELKEGDMVLTINPETGAVEEKPINKVIVQDYDGDLVNFKNRRMDLLVTPNHRMLCEENKKTIWSTAEEFFQLKNKRYLLIGKRNDGIKCDTINVPNIGDVDARALFYICGVFIGDGFLAYQQKKTKNISGYSKPDLIKKSRDLKTGRFMKIVNKNNPQEYVISNSYRIFFDVPEKDKARKQLEASLDKANIKWRAEKNKSGEHVYFSSKDWSEFFKQFGKHARNKQIPLWMFNYSNELLAYLWKGIHDSDGHGLGILHRNVSIVTVSEILKAQLCYLGSMLGYQTRVDKKYGESFIKGRKIKGIANTIYFANVEKILIAKPKKQQYKGKVWCLSVADNKNFLVERNGKTTYCGNTDEVYGSMYLDSNHRWTELDPANPRSPYSATKASAEHLCLSYYNTFGFPAIITRSSNNFGPRQHVEKYIPTILNSLFNDKDIPVYGNGRNIRDWLFVEDNCKALDLVFSKGNIGNIYNIGGNNELSNLTLLNMIINVFCSFYDKNEDDYKDLIVFVPDRPGHDLKYAVCCDKIYKELGWEPVKRNGLTDNIIKTIKWYHDKWNKTI